MSRSSPPRLKVLVTAHSVNSNIFDIRLGRPLRALAQQGEINLRSKPIHEVSDFDFLWADAVVLQRDVDARAARLISLARKLGKIFIFEIDDLLTEPPPFLSIAREPEEKRQAIRYALAEADIVSATTARLSDNLGIDLQKITLTPNYSESITPTQLRHPAATTSTPTTLVLAASDRVLIDFVIPSLKEVCDEFGALVSLVVIGPLADKVSQTIPDTRKIPILPLDDFRRMLSELPNPIGIIPLDDSKFSNCKSAVKFFDYAMLGIPCICSNVPPYSDVIENGRTGILTPNTHNDWSRCIRELATNAPLRKEISSRARSKVLSEHSFPLNQAAWMKIMERTRAIAKKNAPRHQGLSHQSLRIFLLARAALGGALFIYLRKINRMRIERKRAQRLK